MTASEASRSKSPRSNVCGMKMAANFMFVTSTIGLHAASLPRGMVFVRYGLGWVLLLTVTDFAWIALLFSVWVLFVSI